MNKTTLTLAAILFLSPFSLCASNHPDTDGYDELKQASAPVMSAYEQPPFNPYTGTAPQEPVGASDDIVINQVGLDLTDAGPVQASSIPQMDGMKVVGVDVSGKGFSKLTEVEREQLFKKRISITQVGIKGGTIVGGQDGKAVINIGTMSAVGYSFK